MTVEPIAARARFVDDAYVARFGLQAFAQAIDVGLGRPDPAKQFDLARTEALTLIHSEPGNPDAMSLYGDTLWASGLFEQADVHYGEIWYEARGHKTMSRVTSAEGVLEAIYDVEGVSPPAETSQ